MILLIVLSGITVHRAAELNRRILTCLKTEPVFLDTLSSKNFIDMCLDLYLPLTTSEACTSLTLT